MKKIIINVLLILTCVLSILCSFTFIKLFISFLGPVITGRAALVGDFFSAALPYILAVSCSFCSIAWSISFFVLVNREKIVFLSAYKEDALRRIRDRNEQNKKRKVEKLKSKIKKLEDDE